MLAYVQISITALVLIGMIAAFVSFALAAASWIRIYFNKYEPVYIKSPGGAFIKNHIASRFCKIIVSNHITDKCIEDVDIVGLWTLVIKSSDTISTEVKTISKLHVSILEAIEESVDSIQYVKLHDCLMQIERELHNNFEQSNIPTPPYLSIRTYILWVEAAIESFKRL